MKKCANKKAHFRGVGCDSLPSWDPTVANWSREQTQLLVMLESQAGGPLSPTQKILQKSTHVGDLQILVRGSLGKVLQKVKGNDFRDVMAKVKIQFMATHHPSTTGNDRDPSLVFHITVREWLRGILGPSQGAAFRYPCFWRETSPKICPKKWWKMTNLLYKILPMLHLSNLIKALPFEMFILFNATYFCFT